MTTAVICILAAQHMLRQHMLHQHIATNTIIAQSADRCFHITTVMVVLFTVKSAISEKASTM